MHICKNKNCKSHKEWLYIRNDLKRKKIAYLFTAINVVGFFFGGGGVVDIKQPIIHLLFA